MSLLAMLSVAVVLAIRYRSLMISVPVFDNNAFRSFDTSWCCCNHEAEHGYTAIAGILVAIGTGVDDQIVITDETP